MIENSKNKKIRPIFRILGIVIISLALYIVIITAINGDFQIKKIVDISSFSAFSDSITGFISKLTVILLIGISSINGRVPIWVSKVMPIHNIEFKKKHNKD